MKTIDEGNEPLNAAGTLTGGLAGRLKGHITLGKPTGTGKPPWIERFRDFISDPIVILGLDIAKEIIKWIVGQFRALSSALFNKPAIEK